MSGIFSAFGSKKKLFFTLAAVVVLLSLLAATASAAIGFSPLAGHSSTDYEGTAPKYVFLFIGDGMSYPQIASAEMYLGKKSKLNDLVGGGGLEQLTFSKFPVAGAASTYDSSSFIPDSASTATSLASGYKTLSGVINMDVSKQIKYTPITEKLAAKGYKIGIVSSVPINHATPAAFYSKTPSRNNYYDIASQIGTSGFDYYGGGGFLQANGSDGKAAHIYEVLKQKGYTIVDTKEGILNLDSNSKKVVAVNPNMSVDGTSLPYELDRKQGELSLADFTRKGIDILDNPKGFFLMVEGGKIDWANHANDAASSIHDTIAFAKAVEEAVKFYNNHPQETLIIVTGDHECGGMSIGFAATGYATFFDKTDRVKMSHEAFDKAVIEPYRAAHTKDNAKIKDMQQDIKYAFGLLFPDDTDAKYYPEMTMTDADIATLQKALVKSMIPAKDRTFTPEESIMYGTYEPLSVTITHMVNNKAGINFSSYSHSGLPCAVFALGAGQELFNGYYDNTDIYHKMAAIVGVK